MALKSSLTMADKNENADTSIITAERESKLDIKKRLNAIRQKNSSKSKSKELHVRKRLVTSSVTKENLCENNFVSTALTIPHMVATMPTLYPNTLIEWHPVIPLPNIYSIPVIISPTQILTTELYPCFEIVTQPITSPVISQVNETLTYEPLSSYATEYLGSPVENCNTIEYNFSNEDNVTYCFNNNIAKEVEKLHVYDTIYAEKDEVLVDPLGFYLTLPKDLFPSARTLFIDPNPVIDEFCKIPNMHQHTPWILDLEFGIPKSPITRPIPTYNVKFNSIHCKNTPDAIHPGFESCNQDFKKVLLFYYGCVVSTWYNGYMILNHDKSVENFQSWLIPPIQVLGMCWS